MIEFKYEHKDLQGFITTEMSLRSHDERLSEIMQEFRNFLLAIGFQQETVDEYIEAN